MVCFLCLCLLWGRFVTNFAEKQEGMKPTKNKVFCLAIRRTKMVFEEERKALNFIKFNRDVILEETGYAPTRAYYCPFCLGWHVTSNEDTEAGKRRDLLDEQRANQAAQAQASDLVLGIVKGEFREQLFRAVAWGLLGDNERYQKELAVCQDQLGLLRVKAPGSRQLLTLTDLKDYGVRIVRETLNQAGRSETELSAEMDDMSLPKTERVWRKNALCLQQLLALLKKARTAKNLQKCVKLTSDWTGSHTDAVVRGLRGAIQELFGEDKLES